MVVKSIVADIILKHIRFNSTDALHALQTNIQRDSRNQRSQARAVIRLKLV